MRAVLIAFSLLLTMSSLAAAKCADDAQELAQQVEHQQKVKATPQGAAATKALQQAQLDARQLAEVDCYNDVARARKALNAPAPAAATATSSARR